AVSRSSCIESRTTSPSCWQTKRSRWTTGNASSAAAREPREDYRSLRDELDGVSHRQPPAPHDVGIERQAAAEPAVDPLQHVDVLLERVGIERRHDAALAEIA